MPRRKVLWYPKRGIDTTLDFELNTSVDYAVDALNVTTYNDEIIKRRYGIVEHRIQDYGDRIYKIHEADEGLYVASQNGVWRNDAQLSTIPATEIALWYERVFTQDSVIVSSGHVGDFGIFPPTNEAIDTIEAAEPDLLVGYLSGVWSSTNSTFTTNDPVTLDNITNFYCIMRTLEFPYSESEIWLGQVTSFTGGENSVAVITIENWEETNLSSGGSVNPPSSSDYSCVFDPVKYTSLQDYLSYGVSNIYYTLRFTDTNSSTVSNTGKPLEIIRKMYFWSWVVGSPIGYTTLQYMPNSAQSNINNVEIFRLDNNIATAQVYKKIQVSPKIPNQDEEITYLDTITPGSTQLLYDLYNFDGTEETWITNVNYPPINEEDIQAELEDIFFYGNRLWGHFKNRLYYSEAFQTRSSFEYFGLAGLNYLEFPDAISFAVTSETSIYVFLKYGIWGCYGIDPTSMVVREVTDEVGMSYSDGAIRYKDRLWMLATDDKLYQVSGMQHTEQAQISAAIPTMSQGNDFDKLVGSDNNLWLQFGANIGKYDFRHQAIWRYDFDFGPTLFPSTQGTYITTGNTIYTLDNDAGNSYETFDCYILSPKILLSGDVSLKGQLNRVLIRGYFTDVLMEVIIDGNVERSITFSSTDDVINLHFEPVWAYYVQIKISKKLSEPTERFELTAPIALNPW